MADDLEKLIVDLYRCRRMFDHRRQPAHGVHHMLFDDQLRSFGQQEPYRLSPGLRHTFGKACCGLLASPPWAGYLYRLNGLKSLLDREGNQRIDLTSPDRLFQSFLTDHRRSGAWLSLSRVLVGRVHGTRRLDFWTDLDLQPQNLPPSSAYRLGLPRNYLPRDPLVLRCPARLFRQKKYALRVPSILDGYDHAAFFATRDRDRRPSGHALDLNEPGHLVEGAREYVASDLPVDKIQFIPVDWRLGPDRERSLQDNSSLWSQLRDFFEHQGP